MELNSVTLNVNAKSVDRAARPEPSDQYGSVRVASAISPERVVRENETNQAVAPPDHPEENRETERYPSTADVIEAAAQANAKITPISAHRISFLVDEDTGKTVVRVVDAETKEVVRQIPPEEFINMVKALNEMEAPTKGWVLDREG